MTAQQLLAIFQTPAMLFRLDDHGWTVVAQNEMALAKWGVLYERELANYGPKLSRVWKEGGSLQVLRTEYTDRVRPYALIFTVCELVDGKAILMQYSAAQSNIASMEYNDLESRFNLVVSGSKAGVYDWDIVQDRVFWSDRMKAILGAGSYLFSDASQFFWQRVHPDDIDAVRDALQGHLEHCWPFDVECRVQTDAQYYVWVNITGQAVWGKEGQALRLAGSVVDITDRKRTEVELQEREKLIEAILDALPLSVYVKDAHGCMRFFNEEMEKNSGIAREKAIGRTDFELFDAARAHKMMVEDMLVKKKEEPLLTEESLDVNHKHVWWLSGKKVLHYTPLNHASEDWILGFALDITARKQSELDMMAAKDEAEHAARAKGEFLSTMSHEIRTPLNSVIGTAGLLLDCHLDDEQQRYVSLIKQSGEHLLGLINDILDFSKLDAGKMLVDNHPYLVQEQFTLIATILSEQAKHKGLQLKTFVGADVPPSLLGDAHKIRQVLLNLASNAIKFTQEGEVHIKVIVATQESEQRRLIFSVEDTGIGIPEGKIGLLFGEFSQVDASTTRKFGGTGLGLAISKKLVELMGGQIGVQSQEGVGSRFWFALPLIASEMTAAQALPQVEEAGEQRALTILVAEDNAANQMLIRAILKKLGHEVTIAPNGVEALALVQQADYDLVLMDMQMPEMDGLEATQHIRALGHRYSDLPIIALTANALEGDRDRVMDAGMNDYLSKPIDIAKLKKALYRWSM